MQPDIQRCKTQCHHFPAEWSSSSHLPSLGLRPIVLMAQCKDWMMWHMQRGCYHKCLAHGGYSTTFPILGAEWTSTAYRLLLLPLPSICLFRGIVTAFYRKEREKKWGLRLQWKILGGLSKGVKWLVWHSPLCRSPFQSPGTAIITGCTHQLSHVCTLQPQVFLHPSLATVWYPLLLPPTTSCLMGLLVNKPVCSYPENYLILVPFIQNTIHPSTACPPCLVRKIGIGEGDK